MQAREVCRPRLWMCLVAGVLAACSKVSVPELQPAEAPQFERIANYPHTIYRLEPGDVVRIAYTFHPEMDQQTTIRPDGKIRAAKIGEVDAAGRTATELAEHLVELSSSRLRDPEVVVSVIEYTPKMVYVAGEVSRPGPIPYRKGLTPLQAVVQAGGFADTARLDQVVLTRADGREGRTVSRTIDFESSMKKGERDPVYLAPHDVLYVPRTGIAEANIWVDQHFTQLFPLFRGAGGKMNVGQ